MNIPNNPSVKITRTCGEWEEVLARIKKDHSKSNIRSYMRSAIFNLKKNIEDNPEQMLFASGERKSIIFELPVDAYIALTQVAAKMQRPLSHIIDDFLIAPLLTPKR